MRDLKAIILIVSLVKDFAFIGNQHRLIMEEREYFIDLLFTNQTHEN